MRVLQTIAGAQHGGAETFFVTLVLALHRAGLDQRVVMRHNAGRAAMLRAGGLDPVELRFGGPLDLRTRRALKREIAAFKPGVVVSWMSRATQAVSRSPVVHAGWLGGYYPLKHYRRCDHLIAVTSDIVDYLARSGWPTNRAHLLCLFATDEREPAVDRRSLDTPDDAPLLLAMGRLHVAKAFDVLLKALVQVPDAYLWIAGEGPLHRDLEALACELRVEPRVRFLGWRHDRAALLAAADICVFPSRYEPFGAVTIESWAQGVPLVAAAAAGPGATITDEMDGLLVPVDDVGALASAIRRVLDDRDLCARLAAGGHARWQAEFTEDQAVRRWRDFLARVTGSCAASPA